MNSPNQGESIVVPPWMLLFLYFLVFFAYFPQSDLLSRDGLLEGGGFSHNACPYFRLR
jgi:hypothetical protein